MFKKVELDTLREEYPKESIPKLKVYLTIDDLKLRAAMLAYSKYKYEKDLKKKKRTNKLLLFVLSIRKIKKFIQLLKDKSKKHKLELKKLALLNLSKDSANLSMNKSN